MAVYTVRPGDTISVLAVRFRTTIRILRRDNPFIPDTLRLQPGWRLSVRSPLQNARRFATRATEVIEQAATLRDTIRDTTYILEGPRDPVMYKGRLVLEGQIAYGQVIRPTELIEIRSNGFEKIIRTLPVGTQLRVYDKAEHQGRELYLIDNHRWVVANSQFIRYEEISEADLDGKIRLEANEPRKTVQAEEAPRMGIQKITTMKEFNAQSSAPTIGYGPRPRVATIRRQPQALIGSGPRLQYDPSLRVNNDLFDFPVYKRPMMVLRNAEGESTRIELRVLGFNANYGNDIQPAPTNAGWMVNVRAHNLPTLAISGFLMETTAHNEFNDFMRRYHRYIKSRKTDNYYSLGLSTLYYKQTEYRGIVVAFSYSDRQEESLHRKYNMQMLVLREKQLSPNEVRNLSEVVSRQGQTERAFRTNIVSMLHNTITGGTDDFWS